jgi:hypothetical protein
MYHLWNASFHIFSPQNKYQGIFLSDTENITTEDIGKAFKKAKNSFSIIGGELTTVFKSAWNLIMQQKG